MSISSFMERHFRHFNARETLDAARGWRQLLDDGGRMFLTIAGAMSTAELGISLAPLIRAGKVHAICSTAANFEEDVFNLISHNDYKMVPHYRDLSPQEEVALRDQGFNRVTDTCIPETVFRDLENRLVERWSAAAEAGQSYFPHEYMYQVIDEGHIDDLCHVPRENSWVLAAKEMGIPIYTPGYEDSTMGNIFTANCMEGNIKSHACVKSGTQQMEHLVHWYLEHHAAGIGFFQIGGGIAGDFPICAVPLIKQDLGRDIRLWNYFAQIGDSTTSYGSYSGAVPNEKITWYKLDPDAPKYMINSDAAIVAPLVFSYVMGE